MKRQLDPARPLDIQAYTDWMDKHNAIDETESRFLDHKHDLLALPQTSLRRPAPAKAAQKQQPSSPTAAAHAPIQIAGMGLAQSAAIGLPVILILPLMAFAMIPGMMGRLFIISLIGAGEVAVVSSTPELMGIMSLREWA
jgi:hypothetical protein